MTRNLWRDVQTALVWDFKQWWFPRRKWISDRLTPERDKLWWLSVVLYVLQVVFALLWVAMVGGGIWNEAWHYLVLGTHAAAISFTLWTGWRRQRLYLDLASRPIPTFTDDSYLPTLQWKFPSGCERCGTTHATVMDAFLWHEERAGWLRSVGSTTRLTGVSVAWWLARDREFVDALRLTLSSEDIIRAKHERQMKRYYTFGVSRTRP